MLTFKYFDFYGVWVQVSSIHSQLLERIERDFSYFHSLHPPSKKLHYQFYGEKSPPPWEKIPTIPVSFQSANSMTYECGPVRFNDYFGKALTIYHYRTEEGQVYSECMDKLHELLYLMVLSRVGKAHDMRGWHRLHAFGIIKHGVAVLGVMPMKGGKSTHFLEFIKDHEVQMLSDDTPLVSRWGRVRPFPIRVGVEELTPAVSALLREPSLVYQLRREHFGIKTLIPLQALANGVGGDYRSVILFRGVRYNGRIGFLRRCSKWVLLRELIKFQIIGWGLPMILEYFWETGLRDFVRKSFIACSRLVGSFFLLLRAKTYTVYLGTDTAQNVQMMNEEFFHEELE